MALEEPLVTLWAQLGLLHQPHPGANGGSLGMGWGQAWGPWRPFVSFMILPAEGGLPSHEGGQEGAALHPTSDG